jgi:hypothetical protein
MAAPTPWITFGGYTFPITGQEKTRSLKLAGDRKKIPNNYGEFMPYNSSVAGRDIEVVAQIGSNINSPQFSRTILTAADVEAERAFLNGLQMQGRQQLISSITVDRFCLAYLSEFDHNFEQDAYGQRLANWDLKFVADDPRYYGMSTYTKTLVASAGGAATYAVAASHIGSSQAWPVFTITGACTHPTIFISQGGSTAPTSTPTSAVVGVTFSGLTMLAGDTLVITTDPRPENRNVAVVYTPVSTGIPINGLRYAALNDYFNSLDLSTWFPYIQATQIFNGNQWIGVTATGGSFSAVATYLDTWM